MPISCTSYLLLWILTLTDLGRLSISFVMPKIGRFCCLFLLTAPACVRIGSYCCGWLLECWQWAYFFTRATYSDNPVVQNIPSPVLGNGSATRPTCRIAFWVASCHSLFDWPHRWSSWFHQQLPWRSFALLPIISWQCRPVARVRGCSRSAI